MQDKPWIQNLTADNLPNEDLKLIAELIDLDVAIKMMDLLPGVIINIPKNGFRKARAKYIAQNYDGTKKSRLKLIFECGVTENYINSIAKQHRLSFYDAV